MLAHNKTREGADPWIRARNGGTVDYLQKAHKHVETMPS